MSTHNSSSNSKFISSQNKKSSNSSDPETTFRRQFIVNMTKDAWSAYVTHAWGQEALQPISLNQDKMNKLPLNGETILQSITTLWLMGLDEEFGRAQKWIQNMNMNITEFKLENIGALLSAYSLTGESMFKEKAQEIADFLHSRYNLEGK